MTTPFSLPTACRARRYTRRCRQRSRTVTAAGRDGRSGDERGGNEK